MLVAAGGGTTTFVCDLNATTVTFAAQVSAATAGQTICLAAGDYGVFNGTNKAITIVAQSGSGPSNPTAVTMGLTFGSGDTGFTIDGNRAHWNSPTGMFIPGAEISSGASNITIKNFDSTSCPGASASTCRGWNMDPAPGPNSNIVIDHGHFHDDLHGEATIYVWSTSTNDTGITIKNSLFRHSSTDAIHLANEVKVTVLNNKIIDSHECLPTCFGNHTDAIQFDNGNASVVRGNWVQDADQCISGFDSQESIQITHNVVVQCGAHAITMMGDSPASTVAWNTIGTGGETEIICGNKTGLAIPSLTNIYNNIAPGGIALFGGGATCTPTRNDHNVTAAVTYVGGSDPTLFDTFSDFCLAPASAGYTGADDGGQVGVCGGNYNAATDGPPTGEGY